MTLRSRPSPVRPRAVGGATTGPGCPIGSLFGMLAQPHMLHLLHVFLREPGRRIRFGELETELEVSPKTLSRRLKTLVQAGLLVRRQYNEIPPRVDYEATEKTRELGQLFAAMETWANHNTLDAVRTVSVVGA